MNKLLARSEEICEKTATINKEQRVDVTPQAYLHSIFIGVEEQKNKKIGPEKLRAQDH